MFWRSSDITVLNILMTEGSTLFIEFVENFYGKSLEEISDILHAKSDRADQEKFLRLHDFAELHEEQFSPEVMAPLPGGSLAPIFSRGGAQYTHHLEPGAPPTGVRMATLGRPYVDTINPYSALGSVFGPPTIADSKELKAILLYSDRLILVDPFASRRRMSKIEWRMLEEQFGQEFLNPMGMSAFASDNRRRATLALWDRPDEAVESFHLLAAIAPLLRGGVAYVRPIPRRESVYWGDEDAVIHRIAGEVFSRSDSQPIRFRESGLIALVLLERAKDQLLALTQYEADACAFASGELDTIALDILIDELTGESAKATAAAIADGMPEDLARLMAPRFQSVDSSRLTELARLQLPGVDMLDAHDMVTIRDRDVFEVFRSDVRHALAASAAEERIDSARDLFQEEMRAALSRMSAPRFREVVASTTGGDAVAWVMGCIVGWSIASWRGAVAGLAGKASYEMARSRDRGQHAFRNHYLAIS